MIVIGVALGKDSTRPGVISQHSASPADSVVLLAAQCKEPVGGSPDDPYRAVIRSASRAHSVPDRLSFSAVVVCARSYPAALPTGSNAWRDLPGAVGGRAGEVVGCRVSGWFLGRVGGWRRRRGGRRRVCGRGGRGPGRCWG